MSAKSEDSIETKDSGLGDKPTEEFEPRTNTGRKLKEREYLGKDKFNIPGEVLESFIEDLVGDERFRISWLSTSMEKYIYKAVIEKTLEQVHISVYTLYGVELMGHHVDFELLKCDFHTDKPKLSINLENINIVVDQLVENRLLLPWLLDSSKRELLLCMLQLMLEIMHAVLKATELNVLGHKIGVFFSDSPPIESDVQAVEKSTVDPISVMNYVNECLSESYTWYLPNFIEKPILYAIYFMVLTIMKEVFVDFRVNVLGDQVKFHLVKGDVPNVVDMNDDDLNSHLFSIIEEKASLETKLHELKSLIELLGRVISALNNVLQPQIHMEELQNIDLIAKCTGIRQQLETYSFQNR